MALDAAKVASLLRSHGVVPGDRIVVCSRSDVDVARIYFGSLISGVTTVVLDPGSTVAEFTFLIEFAKPRLVLADSELIERAGQISDETAVTAIRIMPRKKSRPDFTFFRPKSKERRAEAASFPDVLKDMSGLRDTYIPDAHGTALVLFTSGTTSRPKGVEITFANLSAQMETLARHYRVHPDSKLVNHLPLFHSDGLNQGPLLAMQAGANLVRPEPFGLERVDSLMDRVYREQPSHLVTVPTMLAMARRLPPDYDDTFSYYGGCTILSTAGKLDRDLWENFEARFGVLIVNSYGLTETCCEALYAGPDADTRRIGTIGKPVDCEARIVDPKTGNSVEEGELWLRGDNVMRGYLFDQAATNEVMKDGWFRTGDLVARDQDGFFRVVGRMKNVIIRGGANLYPDDLVETLLAVRGVREASVIGISTDLTGEQAIACVVSDHIDDETGTAVMAELRSLVAPEKLPDRVLVFERFPHGPSGKVSQPQLRQMIESKMAEKKDNDLTRICSEALEIPISDLSSDMVFGDDPRIDSLRFLQLIMSVERAFSIEFSARETLATRTLGAFIDLVEAKRNSSE
jgi:long-chain acyl-CoA synthetase